MAYLSDELSHAGVKGMKWGVRKDEYRALGRQDRKQYRKKTSKENYVDAKRARKENFELAIEAASKGGNNIFIQTRTSSSYIPTVMTGKEFVAHLISRGAVDPDRTNIFGYTNTPEGARIKSMVDSRLDKIWEPSTTDYVLRNP